MLLVSLLLTAPEPAYACGNEIEEAEHRALIARRNAKERARLAAEAEARRIAEEAERARIAEIRAKREAELAERRRVAAEALAVQQALAEKRHQRGVVGVMVGIAGAIACAAFTGMQLVTQYAATLPRGQRSWIA